jgi:hypothetical protein
MPETDSRRPVFKSVSAPAQPRTQKVSTTHCDWTEARAKSVSEHYPLDTFRWNVRHLLLRLPQNVVDWCRIARIPEQMNILDVVQGPADALSLTILDGILMLSIVFATWPGLPAAAIRMASSLLAPRWRSCCWRMIRRYRPARHCAAIAGRRSASPRAPSP